MNDIRITKSNTLRLKRREVRLSQGSLKVTISLLDAVKALVNDGFHDDAVALEAGTIITILPRDLTFTPLWK